MPRNGCSALHGVNPDLKKKKRKNWENRIVQLIVVIFFGCDYQTVFNPLIAGVAL